jgi:hypothetical protein
MASHQRQVDTNHSSLDRRIHAYAYPCDQEDGRYDAHNNQCKLPLNCDCYNKTGEEERDTLDASIQLLRDALVDAVAV